MCSIDTYFSHCEECNPFWPICDKRLSLESIMIYSVASVPVGWLALAVIYSLDSVQVKYRQRRIMSWIAGGAVDLPADRYSWPGSRAEEWRCSAPRPEPRSLSCVAQYSWRRAVCLLQPRWVCFICSVPLRQQDCFIALFQYSSCLSFAVRLTGVNAE